MIEVLRQFQPFEQASTDSLALIERFAQLVHLPSGRAVRVRSGMRGAFYLVRGSLRSEPYGVIRPDSELARRAVLPGCDPLVTTSAVTLLWVDARADDFLGTDCDELAAESGERWLERFIGSAVISPLGPQGWQRVLRALATFDVAAHEVVVRQGEPGDAFYVIEHGEVAVWQDGAEVATLLAGDFFGEDALISQRCRNATVVARAPTRLRVLAAPAFASLLASLSLHAVQATKHSDLLVSDDPALPAELPLRSLRRHLQGLNQQRRYRIFADDTQSARLAVFVLRHHGFDAWVGGVAPQAGTVRSDAQARSASIESPRNTEIG